MEGFAIPQNFISTCKRAAVSKSLNFHFKMLLLLLKLKNVLIKIISWIDQTDIWYVQNMNLVNDSMHTALSLTIYIHYSLKIFYQQHLLLPEYCWQVCHWVVGSMASRQFKTSWNPLNYTGEKKTTIVYCSHYYWCA